MNRRNNDQASQDNQPNTGPQAKRTSADDGPGAALAALQAQTGGGKICGQHGPYAGRHDSCPSC